MVTIKYKERFNKNFFEASAWQQGQLVVGIDEAGRGCMAGPIVCGAVILFPKAHHPLLKDSKILTMTEREKAFHWIKTHSWWSYAVISSQAIDSYNVYQATLKAMERAYFQLICQVKQPINRVLVDSMPLTLSGAHSPEIIYFNKAERKSTSIAAASIVAKVIRDNLMQSLDPLFPTHELGKHKGYCTALHRSLVTTHGHTIIHRTTFLKNQIFAESMADQLSLITEENNEEINDESIR